MDTKTLRDLEQTGIIKFYGISGIETTTDVAFKVPELIEVRAMSGNTYDLINAGPDKFTLRDKHIVYRAETA